MILKGDFWIKVYYDCDVIFDVIKSKLMKLIDIQLIRLKNILVIRVFEVIQNDICGNGNYIIEKKRFLFFVM